MTRARKIVVLASKKTTSARKWLERDERGLFERDAGEILERVQPEADRLGMTEDQVNDEVATMITLTALAAMQARLGGSR